MRLDSVNRFSTGTRVGFGALMLAKAGAASCHCVFFQPTLIPGERLCLPKLELISTDFTYGMEIAIDVVLCVFPLLDCWGMTDEESSTVLFVAKLYRHVGQFRDGVQNAAESAVKPIYRQFLYEVVPFMLVSIVMNSFILSGVRPSTSSLGPSLTLFAALWDILYLLYIPVSISLSKFTLYLTRCASDFSFSVRVTNDLVFLSRLSQPDNLWSNGTLADKFSRHPPEPAIAMSLPSAGTAARRSGSVSSDEASVRFGKTAV